MSATSDLMSMTGFASRKGQGTGAAAAVGWLWEARSVNGKGLELRLRLPEGIEGLETAVRASLARRFQRGSLSLSLRLTRDGGGEVLRVNDTVLRATLAALSQVSAAAEATGLVLAPASVAEVLAMRGVVETVAAEDQGPEFGACLLADLEPLLDDLAAMRAREGAALRGIIARQIDTIAELAAQARTEAIARRDRMADSLRENLARVLGNSEGADAQRVAQELALIAVKADVTEELDRLDAHVAAARELLAAGGSVGRKLDFLMQEFNREANTLCSKAQAVALTRIGLDLKHVIDQMREQVQNVE